MALRPWEHLGEESLTRFKVFDVRRAVRRSPRTGAEIGMFVVGTLDWVQVVPITTDDELLLVRQYRQGSREFCLEIPGGVIGSTDGSPLATAARELREETGYVAQRIESLGDCNPNPAIFENRLHAFLALGCAPAGELQLDPGEDLEVVTVPIDEVDRMVREGAFDNALVLAGIARWRAVSAGRV